MVDTFCLCVRVSDVLNMMTYVTAKMKDLALNPLEASAF